MTAGVSRSGAASTSLLCHTCPAPPRPCPRGCRAVSGRFSLPLASATVSLPGSVPVPLSLSQPTVSRATSLTDQEGLTQRALVHCAVDGTHGEEGMEGSWLIENWSGHWWGGCLVRYTPCACSLCRQFHLQDLVKLPLGPQPHLRSAQPSWGARNEDAL